ncbi:tight adherence protein B [Palleronia aestuarii]|uniref:Tight adherence protein B n=1 Tax=Palleronia aestuarii TaxID=568105 RepID=A0A2W7MZV2_9RHOB|nr:type II secretion system F family protein [Palleronia aestuarii]PZX13113.1 tight adherence protein B [Palleronia aestuarii]
MSAAAQPFLVFLLTAMASAGMLWALFKPRLDGGSRASDRLTAVASGRKPVLPGALKDRGRKQSVEDALREIAEKETGADGKRRKVSLQLRIRQAGLGWTRKTFYIFGLASALFGFLLATVAAGLGPVPALGFGIGFGLLAPNLYVNRKRARRMSRFVSELPDALDVIVRGVKSGLPLSDCMKAIAAEAPEPVRAEFKAIVDDHTMGMTLADAAVRLPERMPVPEATFFAIVIAIQSRSGGSLSEALGNLSSVVRERKKMKNKIQAMSSEAKASAMIIGALPFLVGGALAAIAPDYVALLFSNIIGNVILAASAFWMLIGILVMRKMIAFDF